ncbi:parkin co-regulated protein-domain-containing protein [Ochromonadaceae sp. CCMP2298]|nr:parkin co-regulated protein-domain-containing protein [Ochromonadaceae sp. CCMP2298]KAJ1443783.1 parkin co-regulated protein-domain-containing protein [Ochromonadaceae sp. CCMP2298]
MSQLNKGILELKLQKKLLEEQLKVADVRINRYGDILDKKAAMRPGALNPEQVAMTSFGVSVADLRIPPRTCKALPRNNTYNPYAIEPEAVVNANIIRIRTNQRINTEGRATVKDKIRAKETKALRLAERHAGRKFPSIPIPPSMLPNRYIRGELPCTIEHGVSGKYLSWASPLENLDYEYYLPLFFDGLQCKDKIITFIACQGIEDMLYASRGHPERITPIIPHLVRPLRNALGKFDVEILLWSLKSLQQLITCNAEVGLVLMPYGKQFLAPIAMFLDINKNIGDSIDYGQRKYDDIGEEIRKVLELMEEFGGPTALRSIKFSIPLYESCLERKDAHGIKRLQEQKEYKERK